MNTRKIFRFGVVKGLESNDVMVQKSLLNAVSQVLTEIPTPSD